MKNKNSKFGLVFTIISNILMVICLIVGFTMMFMSDLLSVINDSETNYDIYFIGFNIIWLSGFIFLFIFIVSMWGIFKKTRNKGWISLIPIYNVGCLSKDILGSPWYVLLLFVPGVNAAFVLLMSYYMGRVFGKKDSYCVLLIFFPTIFWPLFAFDDSKYTRLKKKLISRINTSMNVKNSTLEKMETKERNSTFKIIIGVFKWIITVILWFIGLVTLLTYIDNRLIGYILVGIIFLIYGLLLCPLITDYTKKHVIYTKYKPFIVIVLIMINFMIFVVLPF